MQLFSIGLYHLNLDGSLTLSSSGFPIATYNQDAILGPPPLSLAGPTRRRTPIFNPPGGLARSDGQRGQPSSTTAKTILEGVLIPAGQTAAQDLQTTLDTIFNHPNVGPFVCRQLIQRLVTSNPESRLSLSRHRLFSTITGRAFAAI